MCEVCDANVHAGNMTRLHNADVDICQNCVNELNITRCEGCDRNYRPEEMIATLCIPCFNERAEDESYVAFRQFNESDKYDAAKTGKIISNIRKFGVELEVGFENRKQRAKVSKVLAPEIGITTDGSIGMGENLEIITPPASGDLAEKLIEETCKTLNKYKAIVSKSCGFHLHVDCRDLQDHNSERQFRIVQNIWLFYIVFEDVILSFLSKSRRNNRFCQRLASDYHLKEIATTRNLGQLEEIWYRVKSKQVVSSYKSHTKHESRYRGINLHTLLSAWHLEIRYHMGTTIARKVLEWANLHTSIVDFCSLSQTFYDSDTIKSAVALDLPDKTRLFFDLLGGRLSKKSVTYFYTRQSNFASKVVPSLDKGDQENAVETLLAEVEQ